MSEQEENELICEKLLGWKRDAESVHAYPSQAWMITETEGAYTPTFTTWADAGLILDAVTVKRVIFDVYHHDEDFMCSFGGMPVTINSGTTGPAAIRAAALAYLGAQK